MPGRGKRHLEPNESDPEDLTWGASSPARHARSKSSKPHSKKPPRKRQRRVHDNSDDMLSDDDEESEISYDESGSDHEEEVFLNSNGRPQRRAAVKVQQYAESPTESEATPSTSDVEIDIKPKVKEKKSLMISLRYKRRRGGSEAPAPTRRSSRLTHTNEETIIALSNSGHHAEIVRAGTRSPEVPSRVLRGGKGLKTLPKSTIIEEEEEEERDSIPNTNGSNDAEREIEASINEDENMGEDLHDSGHASSLDAQQVDDSNAQSQAETQLKEEVTVPDSDGDGAANEEEEEDDEDDDPISRPGRALRSRKPDNPPEEAVAPEPEVGGHYLRRNLRSGKQRSSKNGRRGRRGQEESSDFEPNPEEGADEDISDSGESNGSPQKSGNAEEDESSNGRRSRQPARRRGVSRQDPHSEESEAEELAEELADLRGNRPRRNQRPSITYEEKPRRNRKNVDYRILRPELVLPIEEPDEAPTPTRKGRSGGGSAWHRTLFSTYGPFGGAGGPVPVLGGPEAAGATGGVESDSSDDDSLHRPRGVGGAVGMTPTTTATPGFGIFPGQGIGADPLQPVTGTPLNLGKVNKEKQNLADADPLGVDTNVNFDSVGGLQGHIDQLKEMVSLPLLYPEVFQRFHVTPPRGVLFHGPPGTGKTLLARALASSVSSEGRKVTFYMRKGADALSKWVGEAERQLRLLFEEARKNQPSIIFFDEIDGLAPVRSSKQEQIHASIVSTLLALMDGMDGRGQVIVIGATNRPDSIDPALRRPGRFDREFYFPLPNLEARRAILSIHTKGWEPPAPSWLLDELAGLTKGYGGADLRALCTEAALNAVQRHYPQIYSSNKKLLIDPSKIEVKPKDFMICIKKLVPSSERSTSLGSSPLPAQMEPLLRQPLSEVERIVSRVLPQKRKLTALEEAMFEDAEDGGSLQKEKMQQDFDRSRIFRPRLLIRGEPGMGQQYIAAALLDHFEGLHVQSFDLPTLLSDSTRSPEAAVVQLFTEVRRRKPSVIYIPNVDMWYKAVGPTVISTFTGLLRSLRPSDEVLLLGVSEEHPENFDRNMLKDLFGYSKKTQFELSAPNELSRREFFLNIVDYLKAKPSDFPEPENRKKRKLQELPPAPPPPEKGPPPLTKEQLKAQKKRDRQVLNYLKIKIQPIMDQIKSKYKKFRTGVVDESQIRYLYEEEDPNLVSTDLPLEQRSQVLFRPYEKSKDGHGVFGLVEVASGKFFYNLEIVTIEKRLSNGYYKRPKDFLADIKRMVKDARTSGDEERLLRGNELLSNVEVDIADIEQTAPALVAECEHVYIREQQREQTIIEKAKATAARDGGPVPQMTSNVPPAGSALTSEAPSSGPVVLGEQFPRSQPPRPIQHINPLFKTPTRTPFQNSQQTNGYLGDLAHSGSNGLHTDPSSRLSNGDVHIANNGYHNHPSDPSNSTCSTSFGVHSAQPRPLHSHTGAPSLEQRQASSLTQRDFTTSMFPGSQVDDYVNEASTTSSEKKTSNRSSGPNAVTNTQSTNGNLAGVSRYGESGMGPDISRYPDQGSLDRQMPDTQGKPISFAPTSITTPNINPEMSSQSQPHSSQPPVPPFDAAPVRPPNASLHNILNDDSPIDSHPYFNNDPAFMQQVLETLAARSHGFSVEELEQINTTLMDCVWRGRGDWDRVRVAQQVMREFEEVVSDLRECQELEEEQ
ncbi:MAG: hypothetical protein M1834_002707 [Cirrosporium novae-zelandiae]|nr:MAG: hypothetical protein M1834_002707 [Cirrosporium novae-zelandiae]